MYSLWNCKWNKITRIHIVVSIPTTQKIKVVTFDNVNADKKNEHET